jgi:hypothetical protein
VHGYQYGATVERTQKRPVSAHRDAGKRLAEPQIVKTAFLTLIDEK